MAISGYPYKYNARQSRSQHLDENFLMGMLYSNAPIAEGFSKVLLNYDTDAVGEILTPRPGFRVKEYGLDTDANPIVYDAAMSLFGGKVVTDESSNSYYQVVVGVPTDSKRTDSKQYYGNGHIATIPLGTPDALSPEGISQFNMKLRPMTDETNGKLLFTKPDVAEIHGIPLQSVDTIAKHVGTYGFNNMYYYFDEYYNTETEETEHRLMQTSIGGDQTYLAGQVSPKAISPTEAVQWGYNMLADSPYTFANTNFAGNIQLLGLLPYDENNSQIVSSPLQNQKLTFRAYYAGNTANKYKFKWEWKDTGSSNWTLLKEEALELTALPELSVDFSSPAANVIIQLTAYRMTGETVDPMPEKVIAMGIAFLKAENTNNTQLTNYDLSEATGMSYWKNRLVLWGIPSNPFSLFMSDVNDPSYFPYPQCSDIMEEPIVHAMPLNDSLLVFTTASLYMLTLSPDGLSWFKKKIQTNLNIAPWDIHLIQAVKNMVFFKSGNYYYMVVPSKTTIGDLVVAPISKNMMYVFDNFDKTIKELAEFTYDYKGSLELVHYYNFLDFEDIHNVYVFKTDSGIYLNFIWLYSTLTRAWRCYTVESESVLLPFRQDLTKPGLLMTLTPIDMPNTTTIPMIQFIEKDFQDRRDYYVPKNTAYSGLDDFGDIIAAAFEEVHTFKNWQFLDTGYRQQQSSNKKRYRELQFQFNNISAKSLQFYTDFFLDGEQRYSMFQYDVVQELDTESPDYGLITLERTLVDPTILPGETILAENTGQWNHWALDNSRFPEVHLWKIRMSISGKGYSPRMRFLSQNEDIYEILSLSWIYRMMNAR